MSRIKEYLTVVITDRTTMVYEENGVIYVPEQRQLTLIDKDEADCINLDARRSNPNDRIVLFESVMVSKNNSPIFEEVLP